MLRQLASKDHAAARRWARPSSIRWSARRSIAARTSRPKPPPPSATGCLFAALGERFAVEVVAARSEQARLLSVPGHPLAAQIAEVRRHRCGARRMANDALDHGEARAAGEQSVLLHCGALSASETRAVARTDRARIGELAAGALGRGGRLRKEMAGLAVPCSIGCARGGCETRARRSLP